MVSMLTKVVTSYVQFMSLAREIDYPWPNVVVAGTTGTQVHSVLPKFVLNPSHITVVCPAHVCGLCNC